MITRYQTSKYWGAEIKKVIAVRETDKCIFIEGDRGAPRREPKVSDYHHYHNTWNEARDHLMAVAEESVRLARRHLERAHSKLGNIKGLKPPVEKEET